MTWCWFSADNLSWVGLKQFNSVQKTFFLDTIMERSICKTVGGCSFWSIINPAKSFALLLELGPFSAVTFRKSRGATHLKYIIPVQVSRGLNKLCLAYSTGAGAGGDSTSSGWFPRAKQSWIQEPHLLELNSSFNQLTYCKSSSLSVINTFMLCERGYRGIWDPLTDRSNPLKASTVKFKM